MSQIGFMVKEANQPDVKKILDFINKDNLDNEQLLTKMLANPQIKAAAEQMKKLLQAAGQNAGSDEEMPKDLGLEEGAIGDAWLKLSVGIANGVESLGGALQDAVGLNPKMAALGAGLLAMTVASSDPKQAESIMKLAMAAASGDGDGFLEQAADIGVDMTSESKRPLEDTIMEAVMDLLDEDYIDEVQYGKSGTNRYNALKGVYRDSKKGQEFFLKKYVKDGAAIYPYSKELSDEDKQYYQKIVDEYVKGFAAEASEDPEKQKAGDEHVKKVDGEVEKTMKAEPDASKIATDVDLSYAEKTYGSALAPLKLSEPKIKVVYKLIAVGKLLTDKTIEDLKTQRAKEQVNENFSKRLQNFKNLINPPYIGGQVFVANAQKFFNKDEMALVMSFTSEEVKSINDAVSKVDSQLENNPEVKDNAAAIVAAVNNKANPDKPPEEKKDAVDNTAGKLEVEEPEVIEKAKEMVAGQPEGEAGELDVSKIEERYGQALKQFLDDNEYLVVIKFLAILMKAKLIQEGPLQDTFKVLNIGKGWSDVLKQAQADGTFTKDERKLLISVLKDPEKSKQFIAAIQQSEKQPQEKEPQEKEDSGEDKSIGDFDPQELMNSIIVFVGKHSAGKPPTAVGEAPQPGSRPNFFYPHDNMLSTQSQILHSLYSQMRKVLKLDPEDLSREMRAFNDESATAPDKTEPAGEEQPTPEPQSEGLVREQKFDPKRVGPENFVSLRSYVQDTLEAVEQYKQVTLKGQKGSTTLFNKYKSQIGTDAQNPKEVLYKILLPNVVNLANALAARIEFEMKKRTKGKEKEAQQDSPPEGEEQDQQVQKESLMESAGDEYLKKVQTIKAVFEKIIDIAPRLHDTLKQITGEDLKPIKDIRTASQNIYSELEKIREFFPLTKPFKSELHGSQGFDDAVSRTSTLLQTVNRALVPVSTFDSFEDMKTASLKPILAALDTVVDTIKEIFSGEFDKRPSYNDETDYEDHEQAMKKDTPDDPDSPGEEDPSQQAKDELDDQTLQIVEDLEVQLETYRNFYETLRSFMIAKDSGVGIKGGDIQKLMAFLMQ